MSVRDSFGCRYEIEFTVPDFRFNLEADFIFSPDENPITGILPTVSFLNQSENATDFTWYFDSGDVSTEFEPDYIFPGSGTYDVKLIAENPFGCKESIISYSTFTLLTHFLQMETS
jgi:PKD repeat protein